MAAESWGPAVLQGRNSIRLLLGVGQILSKLSEAPSDISRGQNVNAPFPPLYDEQD